MSGRKKKNNLQEGVLASNRKASRDYQLLESWEAGLVLTGTEVKSIKLGHVSIQEGYVQIDDRMEAWLVGCTVQPYAQGNIFNHRSDRDRKLLMHRNEIERLHGKSREKGLTIIPLRLYLAKWKDQIEARAGSG